LLSVKDAVSKGGTVISSLIKYPNIISTEQVSEQPLCGEFLLKGLDTNSPTLVIPYSYKTYWLTSDPGTFILKDGQEITSNMRYLIVGDSELSFKKEEGKELGVWACAYKEKVPLQFIVNALSNMKEAHAYTVIKNQENKIR